MNTRALRRRLRQRASQQLWGPRAYLAVRVPRSYIALPLPRADFTPSGTPDSGGVYYTYSQEWTNTDPRELYDTTLFGVYVYKHDADLDPAYEASSAILGVARRAIAGEASDEQLPFDNSRRSELVEAHRYFAWNELDLRVVLSDTPVACALQRIRGVYAKAGYLWDVDANAVIVLFAIRPDAYTMRSVMRIVRVACREARRAGAPIRVRAHHQDANAPLYAMSALTVG